MDVNPGSTTPDDRMAAALTAFARSTAGAGVSVAFVDGVATISGDVATPTARAALVDLVRWHEGVRHVINRVEVRAPQPVRTLPAGD